MAQPWLIGIGGTNASGKDTLAEYLAAKYQYLYVSSGNMVREIAIEREGNIFRPTLYSIANDLRAEEGGGVLVARALQKYEKVRQDFVGLVTSSIRTKGEVELLKNKGGVIIFIDADIKMRYERIKSRKRADDFITFEEFQVQERVEWHQSDNPAEFSVLSVKEVADYSFTNTGDETAFFADVEKVLSLK